MESTVTATGVPQWVPTDRDIADARVTDFARFVEQRTGLAFPDYAALWQWSVADIAGFGAALWDYFDIGPRGQTVLDRSEMPGVLWFPGTTLNYVDQITRNARTDRPAIIHVSEDEPDHEVSWDELLGRSAAFAEPASWTLQPSDSLFPLSIRRRRFLGRQLHLVEIA